MNLDKIPIGANPPHEVNVIIEIPLGGNPVKYEMDKESGAMLVDRFLHTAMYYPCNYGFIPHTLSEDGDPTDAAVLGQMPVVPGCVIQSRPIGVLIMEDESGIDEKILCVPIDKLHPFYGDVSSYRDVRPVLIEQIQHFFEHYKDLEKNKWVKVKRWGEVEEAIELIRQGIERARQKGHDAILAADRERHSFAPEQG
ncbi:MAG: inorganic diphosphatase [Proteobacteria bacterium]|nr:inorganic diphosphatase [Pseudomonadota bacterium]